MNRYGAIIPVVGFELVKNSVITIQRELEGHKIKAEESRGERWRKGTAERGEGSRRNVKYSSLEVRLDTQGHVWALVLTTLDVSLSDGRDVGPGHVISRHCWQKLESPD